MYPLMGLKLLPGFNLDLARVLSDDMECTRGNVALGINKMLDLNCLEIGFGDYSMIVLQANNLPYKYFNMFTQIKDA